MGRILLIIGALMLLPMHSASALGLGELKVESELNDFLVGRIDLQAVKPGDMVNLDVRLAEPEVFEDAGLPRPYILSKLRFETVSTSDNAGYIKVTSKERIREPYLNFILEVVWHRGRILREYSVLLGKPE